MNVETEITPPDTDEDDGGHLPSARLSVNFLDVDGVHHDAGVQFFGEDTTDPEKFAEALLRTALAVASLRGSDYSWAAFQRFAAYDGMPS